jgi:quercetin dioxygenase-like cupin family protein
MPNMDERGLHTTRTIDFGHVVQGRLSLILDEETVEVHEGDFVILQAGRHAWENTTEELAILSVVLLRPPEAV